MTGCGPGYPWPSKQTLRSGSPRANRSSWLATKVQRRVLISSVQAELCGYRMTLSSFWKGKRDGQGLGSSLEG